MNSATPKKCCGWRKTPGRGSVGPTFIITSPPVRVQGPGIRGGGDSRCGGKLRFLLPGDIEVTHGGRHDKIRFQEPEKKLLWW